MTSGEPQTKEMLSRFPFYRGFARWWGERRLEKQILRLGRWYEPLHGDRILQNLMDGLIQNCDVTTFVETGTFVGDTTKYVALRYPKIKVHTCELNKRWLKLAQRFCEGIGNIEFYYGRSPRFLQNLSGYLIGEWPIFWLDAHWGDYWPLVDETKVISTLPRYLIFIDDFEVPGRPRFPYEVYNGVKNTLRLHEKVLGGRCYVPDYDPELAGGNPAGYGVFQKGMECSRLEAIGYLKEITR